MECIIYSKCLFDLMSFHVQRQVVTSGERSCAQVTLERLLTRVLPIVSGQLVRPGELPLAAFPRTLVRLLARVSPLVSLQVGALGVDLVAVGEVALVNFSLLQAVGVVARWTQASVFVVVIVIDVVVVGNAVAADGRVDQQLPVFVIASEELNLRLCRHQKLLRDGVRLERRQ